MGRTQVFKGIELTIPDAYSALDLSRLLTPTSGGVGIVALVGEAEGGKPGIHIFPGGLSPAIVKRELKGGAGADMVRLALRSGVDPLVQSGASTVVFYKTNNSTQSSLAVSSGGFTIKTKQYGSFTALYTAEIASVGGSKFLTVRDEFGLPEVSAGVGVKAFATIQRSSAGGATAAQARLQYVSGKLHLQTQVDTGSGMVDELDLDVTGLTLSQVKTLVQNVAGYSFAIPSLGDEQLKIEELDMVTAYQPCFTAAYAFKASVHELVVWAKESSQLVEIERGVENAVLGVPAALAVTKLAGGSRGTTSNSSFQTAMNDLLQLRVNILVPLFSEDNQDGSTVTVESINSIVKDHVVSRSSILGRSECQAYVAIKGNKDAFKAEMARMGSRWVAVTSQKITDLTIDGAVKQFPEYAFNVVLAQTQAGSPIGTPLTYRLLPVSGITQDVSWNPIENGPEMIKAGGLIAGLDENNQIRVIAGYTSWLGDSNNANIYIETVESLAIFAFNHRMFMKQKFLGQSAFTRQDIMDAIKESLTFERDTTRSIKGFDAAQTKLISTTAGRLEYELAVVPFEGIVFVLPTVVAIREVA